MKLTIDFETRCAGADLRKTGSRVYAEDPTLQVLMLAAKVDDQPARIWLGEHARVANHHDDSLPLWSMAQLFVMVDAADIIEAHNVAFERDIWNHHCVPVLGWPPLPEEKLRCSAAMARRCGMPGDLKTLGQALGLDEQKDNAGRALMLKMCKPRPIRQVIPEGTQWLEDDWQPPPVQWFESAEDMWNLAKYCIQDVDTEHAASEELGEMSGQELDIWRLDQKINERGVYIDRAAATLLMEMGDTYKAELRMEYEQLTRPGLSPQQAVASLEFFAATFGDTLANFQAATVSRALLRDLHPSLRRCLEIRQAHSRTSNAKYPAMLTRSVAATGRLHGAHLYHGAHTGRWAGRGLQTQNLPRPDFPDAGDCVDTLHLLGTDFVLHAWDEDPLDIGATCIRPCISAPPGKILICADYNAIEGRVLAWVAGEEDALEVYHEGDDPYVVAAEVIFGKPYHVIQTARMDPRPEVAHAADKLRAVGKVSELALGYQGGENAYATMASGYGVDLGGLDIKAIIKTWRGSRPMTVKFWKEVNKISIEAVQNPGRVFKYREVSFRFNKAKKRLYLRLPSGRLLVYYDPLIGENRFGKPCLTYMGICSKTHRWMRLDTYGGKLTENIVQAIARDILCEGMIEADKSNFDINMHVHDEVVAEEPRNSDGGAQEALDFLCRSMVTVGEWAEGLPLKAEGWYGRRYRK